MQSRRIIQKNNKGQLAVYGEVPYRNALTEKIFFPNVRKFIVLVNQLFVTHDMERFSRQNNVMPTFNVRDDIFAYDAYKLKGIQDNPEAQAYREELASKGDVVEDESGFVNGSKIPKLNPLIFDKANVRTQLSLKILTDMMSADWDRGSALELGHQSIYDSTSFEAALVERLCFVNDKWSGMSEDDRIAWLRGKFTHSEDARRGHYDTIRMASPNTYTG